MTMQVDDDALGKYMEGISKYPGFENVNDQESFDEKKKRYFVTDEKKKFDVDATAERFKYLLSLTPLFKHFLNVKAEKDENFKRVLEKVNDLTNSNNKSTNNSSDHRRRKTEKEEDNELMKSENNELQELLNDDEGEITDSGYEFTKSPKYINGSLRPYQIQGLNWLVSLNTNDLSGILADEMGLGKTLQTISFLGYLRYLKKVKGPHIVIVPKSTLENWQREFSKWTPEVKTCILTGDQENRNRIIKENITNCKFDVLISSYEIVIREKAILKKINWQYIIVDEAHRLKNEDSLLSQIIRMFHSKNRLLITGTPLQNNLHELWALLNFLLPDIFADSTTFDGWFSNDGEIDNDEQNGNSESQNRDNVVGQLHQLLKPFLLRRIKNDVEKSLLPKQELNIYVGMTKMQKRWYQSILEKDIDAVNGSNGKKESKSRLLNIVMQLRKCCNHPYLFEGAEPGPPYTTDEHLVFNSQKMLVLDKLLKKLKNQGSRVLIFSQMSRMLDILEDYAVFRNWGYCRIDGQTEHADRIEAIDEYNKEGSDKFLFLLTTRAGGLGINLTSADVVVLYDSDWNPQADLQAMDRAHRIGQKKQVKVFRFVTENAIEEKVLERASQKLRLDQLVIQQGRNGINEKKNNAQNNKDELLNMIQFGAVDVLTDRNGNSSNNGNEDGKDSNGGEKIELDDDELDKILMKSEERTGELKNKFSQLGLDDLQNFSSSNESVYEWDGKNFQKKEIKSIAEGYNWLALSKRERKNNYSVDGYYREVLQTGNRGISSHQQMVNAQHNNGNINGDNGEDAFELKQPKHLALYDHQFYNERLHRIYEMEWAYYKRVWNIKAKNEKGSKNKSIEDLEIEQAIIDHARPLTEEEEEEKKILLKEGFSNWSRRDFFTFINANARFSRYDLINIAKEFGKDKTYEEVCQYSLKFWENFRDIENYDRYIGQIEAGEEKIRRAYIQREALRFKVSEYDYPLRDMEIQLPYTATKKEWSIEEDRWLIVQMLRLGGENGEYFGEQIFNEIQYGEHLFMEGDYWILSRNAVEIKARCQTLLQAIVKEYVNKKKAKKSSKKKTVSRKRKINNNKNTRSVIGGKSGKRRKNL